MENKQTNKRVYVNKDTNTQSPTQTQLAPYANTTRNIYIYIHIYIYLYVYIYIYIYIPRESLIGKNKQRNKKLHECTQKNTREKIYTNMHKDIYIQKEREQKGYTQKGSHGQP